jgi:hypothetical protein
MRYMFSLFFTLMQLVLSALVPGFGSQKNTPANAPHGRFAGKGE